MKESSFKTLRSRREISDLRRQKLRENNEIDYFREKVKNHHSEYQSFHYSENHFIPTSRARSSISLPDPNIILYKLWSTILVPRSMPGLARGTLANDFPFGAAINRERHDPQRDWSLYKG